MFEMPSEWIDEELRLSKRMEVKSIFATMLSPQRTLELLLSVDDNSSFHYF